MWREHAACRGMDPDLFHPSDVKGLAAAQLVCVECPVRPECLDYAIAHHEMHGIWGGESERSRRRIARQRRLRRVS